MYDKLLAQPSVRREDALAKRCLTKMVAADAQAGGGSRPRLGLPPPH